MTEDEKKIKNNLGFKLFSCMLNNKKNLISQGEEGIKKISEEKIHLLSKSKK